MKTKFLLAVGLGSILALSSAFALDGTQGNTLSNESVRFVTQTSATTPLPANQCLGANETVNYYLNGDLNKDGIPDLGKVQFFTDNYRYFGDANTYRLALQTVNSDTRKGTEVRYYLPEQRVFQLYHNNTLTNIANTHVWYRASNVFPLNQWTRAVSSQPLLISAPANKDNSSFQVAYQIRHAVFRGYKSTGNGSYVTMPVRDGSDNLEIGPSKVWWLKGNVWDGDGGGPIWQSDFVNQLNPVSTRAIDWSTDEYSHDYECVNVNLAWCGDGKVQTGAYANGTAAELCDPNDPTKKGWGENGCSVTCQPLNPDPVYDLALTKRVVDKKAAYRKGETVTFTITVFNQGNKVARNIEVTDYIPEGLEVVDTNWAVAGNLAKRTIAGPIAAGQSTSVTLQMRLKPDFTGTEILNLAEITRDNSGEYGLTDKDSTPDQNKDNDCFNRDNLHLVNGNGKDKSKCDPTTDEDDHDGDSLQILDQTYDLALTKRVQDKKPSYKKGDIVTYTITVYNQGNVVARNIEVTDYIPEGLEVVDTNWAVAGNLAKRTIAGPIAAGQSTSVTLQMRLKPDFKSVEILNLAEITRDNSGDYGTTDNDSTPDQNKDNDCFLRDNRHLVNGNGKDKSKCDPTTDEDDHDGDIITTLDEVYDLALTKVIKAPAKTSYSLGDTLTFLLTVHNQGNVVARNVQITDYLPRGLTLKDARWTFDSASRKATIAVPGEIAVEGSASVEMTVTIDGDFTGSKILNKAEISQDNAADYGTTDKDSTPDTTDGNDCFSENFLHRTTGNGKAGSATNCNESTDEDDHDGVPVIISKPTIKKDLQETGKVYQVGDLVGFVMPFANNTNETVNNVSVKDILPLNLEYVSSEIEGVVAPHHATFKLADGKTTMDVWSGFNLLPGQKGTLYLTGRVLESNLDARINTVGIYTNDILVEKDAEPYPLGGRKVIIQKSVAQREVKTGQDADYLIKVSVTEGSYDELIVTDTLPLGLVYKANTYAFTGFTVEPQLVEFTTTKNAQGLDVLTWRLKFPNKISANQHFSIALKATLTATERKNYTNVACVIDPKRPNDAPICDPEDITPPPPPTPTPTTPTMNIKKYVNRREHEAGREDVLMTGFASGDTAYFTIEALDATAGMTEFTITDTITGNLSYIDSSKMLNDAFTGVFLRGPNNSTDYAYSVVLSTETLASNHTKLTWKVTMTRGEFLPGDKYRVQFMAKVTGDQKNVAILTYPGDKPKEDDASVKTEEVKLNIKKYVADRIDGNYVDDTLNTSASSVYFKLVISGATNSLTGFRVTDRIENNLKFDHASTGLANDAFTGVITFGPNNPTKPAYKITPTITGTHPVDVEWKIEMLNGASFMPGDSLTIIFKATKTGDQTNTAHVEYPKRDGTTGKSSDPAAVRYSGGWGGNPPRGGGWGGGSYSPSCGNGRKDGNEICDLGPNGGTIGSDGKLFLYSNETNKDYAGYNCTAACGVAKGGEKIAPKCFNVQNGSISIMKGEVLPFYWNLDGIAGKRTIQEKRDWLTRYYVKNSSEADSEQKIDISSMMCKFVVYAPGKNLSNPAYTFTTNCFNVNGWKDAVNGTTYPSINDWISQNRNGWLGGSQLSNKGVIKNVFDSLDNQNEFPILFPLSSKLYIRNFGAHTTLSDGTSVRWTEKDNALGEYKLALEEITYVSVSKDTKGVVTTENHTFNERICEVDFAVTDPYMIQRSPYGIGNKATTALSKYKLMNGTSFMSQFFKTDNVNAAEYAAPKNIQSLFNTFKNKYAQLAKPVNWNKDLLKVPGKSIYLYKGTTELNELLGNAVTSKPFTLIAMSGQSLTIKGDLNANAMIMTSGKIIFDASNSCNGGRIAGKHAGQVVRGIFYAGAGFDSSNHAYLRNTEDTLNDKERCNYGNLHIKGVAIGDLSKVVEARRSELYTWFEGNGGGSAAAEKTQKVINGASVLVDYNPTLRGNLPPGANEFNKALAVYRK